MIDPRNILALKPLTNKNRKFYKKCKKHLKFLSMYCISCDNKPRCQSCFRGAIKSKHYGHQVVQVQKSTRKNAIKEVDIKKDVDVSDILRLVNNHVDVLMIGTRKKAKSCSANNQQHCIRCGFVFKVAKEQPAAKYCSIGCKVKNIEDLVAMNDDSRTTRTTPTSDLVAMNDDSRTQRTPPTSDRVSYRKRPRKGNPQRAPFY